MNRDRILASVSILSLVVYVVIDVATPVKPPPPEYIYKTVRAPALAPPKVTNKQLVKDDKLTAVKIDHDAMKRIMMMAYDESGNITESVANFLKMSPAEKEAVEASIKKTIEVLKPMEVQNRKLISNKDGDSIVVKSFWDTGGKEEFEKMRDSFKNILGDERSGLMMVGIETSATNIGNFGFFDTIFFVQDGSMRDENGNPDTEVHIQHVDPSRAIRKAALQEPDPDKRVAMLEAYQIKKDQIKNQAPIEPIDYIMSPNTPLIVNRYHHLFQGLEAPDKPE
jgi:hypothetical protein